MLESAGGIRAKEFMQLLAIEKDKFYALVNSGDLQQPICPKKTCAGSHRTSRIKLKNIKQNLL